MDVAFKVVGTGSVGLRDYVIYFQGNGLGDPLFLQIKEEARSTYEPYLQPSSGGIRRPRVTRGSASPRGSARWQLQSDPFLGWTTIADRDYLVRQLNDYKGSLDLTELKGQGLIDYGQVCGELLARGHRPLRRRLHHWRLHRQRQALRRSDSRVRRSLRRTNPERLAGAC